MLGKVRCREFCAMPSAFEAHVAKSSTRLAPERDYAAEILLTPAQKRLIRQSFTKLVPALDLVGQLFYLKLFRLDPSFRARFGGDPKTQSRKFMAAVKLTVIALNYDDGLAPVLKLLGIGQRQMGLKVRDYRTVGKALIWTFEQSLQKSFTRQTKDAWTVFITQATRLLSGSDAALLRSVS
jgi:hemoglobin-like flavoprotein